MRISGLQIIQQAFAQFGAWAPEPPVDDPAGGVDTLAGEQLEPGMIEQAEILITAKLEELATSGRFVPGVTVVEHPMTAGKAAYLIGSSPNADWTVASTPHAMQFFTIIDGDGTEHSGVAVQDAKTWQQVLESINVPPRPRYVFSPGSGQEHEARPFTFWPTPQAAFTVRLFLWLPTITAIDADTDYDLPNGAAQVILMQSAAALAPVYGTDPDSRSAIEVRANIALNKYQQRNNRYRKRLARLPRRWLTRVSGGRHNRIAETVGFDR